MSERPSASLHHAWQAEIDDPVRILVPAAGLLALDLALVLCLRLAWSSSVEHWALWLVGSWWAVQLVGAPLRAIIIHLGALAGGRESRGAVLPLIGVHMMTAGLRLVAAAVGAIPLVGAGLAMLGAGWYSLGTAVVAAGAGLGTVLSFMVRWGLAYAPAHAVMKGRGALPAASASWAQVRDRPGETALILLAPDILTVGGGLLCGAGALPGYPLSDLALSRRVED